MKAIKIAVCAVFLVMSVAGMAAAEDLKANEKAVHSEFVNLVPKDKVISVEQFKQIHDEILAGKREAYMIDCRTHPEFYAFHIEGADHIHAGHMYTIPKKIKDPNAEIYVWCRTSKRATYTAGFLYKYGYKNVYLYKGGVVGWAKAGHPFVNQFTGKFKILEYRKIPSDVEKSFRVREFHPY